MAAEEQDSGAGLGLPRPRGMEGRFSVEALTSLNRELCRVGSRCARRQAGALLSNRSEACSFLDGPGHAAHHAVMLAVLAAAGGEVRLGVLGKQRRNQHPTEEEQQQMGRGASHHGWVHSTQNEEKESDLDQI